MLSSLELVCFAGKQQFLDTAVSLHGFHVELFDLSSRADESAKKRFPSHDDCENNFCFITLSKLFRHVLRQLFTEPGGIRSQQKVRRISSPANYFRNAYF